MFIFDWPSSGFAVKCCGYFRISKSVSGEMMSGGTNHKDEPRKLAILGTLLMAEGLKLADGARL